MKIIDLNKYNWNEIQEYHNGNKTLNDIYLKYNIKQ